MHFGCFFVHPLSINKSINLCIYPGWRSRKTKYLSFYQSISLSFYRTIYLNIYLNIYISLYLSRLEEDEDNIEAPSHERTLDQEVEDRTMLPQLQPALGSGDTWSSSSARHHSNNTTQTHPSELLVPQQEPIIGAVWQLPAARAAKLPASVPAPQQSNLKDPATAEADDGNILQPATPEVDEPGPIDSLEPDPEITRRVDCR